MKSIQKGFIVARSIFERLYWKQRPTRWTRPSCRTRSIAV